MLVLHDVAIRQFFDAEVVEATAFGGYLEVQHLVKIAVVKEAIPANGDGIAAHKPINR
jgi:hypothetical protein